MVGAAQQVDREQDGNQRERDVDQLISQVEPRTVGSDRLVEGGRLLPQRNRTGHSVDDVQDRVDTCTAQRNAKHQDHFPAQVQARALRSPDLGSLRFAH